MKRGGKRPGAGRKKGAKTKRTQEIAAKAASEGISPLEHMLSVLRDETAGERRRDEMAKAAAPYIHPRLAAIEHTGRDGGPIETADMTAEALKGLDAGQRAALRSALATVAQRARNRPKGA